MSISIKIHNSYRQIVSICDTELLGKKFEEKFESGIKQLDVRENFYKGEEAQEEKAIEIMRDLAKEDATFNIVGAQATQAALKAGIISREGIKIIQEIPFALVLL